MRQQIAIVAFAAAAAMMVALAHGQVDPGYIGCRSNDDCQLAGDTVRGSIARARSLLCVLQSEAHTKLWLRGELMCAVVAETSCNGGAPCCRRRMHATVAGNHQRTTRC